MTTLPGPLLICYLHLEAPVTRDAGASSCPGESMQRPPWWYWLQWRDLVPVLISMLVLVGFLSVSTWLFGQSVVLVLNHIRKAWDHP